MSEILYLYQHLSFYINPTAFSVGPFQVDWYSLMYLAGFLVVYLLLRYRIRRGENLIENQKSKIKNQNFNSKFKINTEKIQDAKRQILNAETLLDFLFWLFIGLLIGARLGYVLFYNFGFYLENPLAIISPFDASGNFVGIYGMSYHGGLIGVLAAAFIFSRKYNINLLKLGNFIAPAIPAGYFFGRVGNFLNGELYGRITESVWGMYFPSDPAGFLRHPSQLYEALLEGLLLFAALWLIRNKAWAKNKLLAFYLIGYAASRMAAEIFREPDPQIGYFFGILTLGQILSLAMLFPGFFILFNSHRPKKMI